MRVLESPSFNYLSRLVWAMTLLCLSGSPSGYGDKLLETECFSLKIISKTHYLSRLGRPIAYASIDENSLILDTQLLKALNEGPYDKLKGLEYLYRYLLVKFQNKLFFTTRFNIEEIQRGFESLPPENVNMVRLQSSRQSNSYQSILAQLKDAQVGGVKGEVDQQIVADAFFALRNEGIIPTFVTADKGIYAALCRMSPHCQKKVRNRGVANVFPDGFYIELTDSAGVIRTLKVIPIPPFRQ